MRRRKKWVIGGLALLSLVVIAPVSAAQPTRVQTQLYHFTWTRAASTLRACFVLDASGSINYQTSSYRSLTGVTYHRITGISLSNTVNQLSATKLGSHGCTSTPVVMTNAYFGQMWGGYPCTAPQDSNVISDSQCNNNGSPGDENAQPGTFAAQSASGPGPTLTSLTSSTFALSRTATSLRARPQLCLVSSGWAIVTIGTSSDNFGADAWKGSKPTVCIHG